MVYQVEKGLILRPYVSSCKQRRYFTGIQRPQQPVAASCFPTACAFFLTNIGAFICLNTEQGAYLIFWRNKVQTTESMDKKQYTPSQIKMNSFAWLHQVALKRGRDCCNRTLDLLLPPRCVLCGMSSGSSCICGPCKIDLPWTGLHCHQCRLPLASPNDDICGACIQNPPPFSRTVCPLQYQFPADRLVQSFKFNRQLAAGRILSQLMCECIMDHDRPLPEVLIPVPLHKLRMIKRGFNQACELASHIGRVLDIPVLTASLRRHRNTKAQSGLSRKQRRKNVRGAFYWHSKVMPAHHVALIDDVMTTGTTAAECARVLKKAGAKRVDIWVAARAIPANRQ